jgi:hypothetical protein
VSKQDAKRSAEPKAGPAAAEEDHLDKVRDILFGAQVRESESRFKTIEQRLAKDVAAMQAQFSKRCDSLEQYAKSEMAALASKIATEQAQRTEAVKALTKSLADTAKALGKKLGNAKQQADEERSALREQILAQSKSLRKELHASRAELKAASEQAAAELRDQKADRTSLAAMFAELAMHLSGETPPEKTD